MTAKTATMTRRNVFIPDDLWERATLAAMRQSLKEGKPVSTSEWIRRAMEAELLLREKGGKM